MTKILVMLHASGHVGIILYCLLAASQYQHPSVLHHSSYEFAPVRTEALIELRAQVGDEDILRPLSCLMSDRPDLGLRH